MPDQTRQRIEPMPRDAVPAAAWATTVPVRFRHCDPAGIVFTPRYFEMLTEAVELFFADRLGFDYYALIGERRLGLGYAHASCEFLRPSRMGEVLEVAVLLSRVGRASYAMTLPVFKDGAEAVRGRLVTVTTSLDTLRPCPIPDDLRGALARYAEACGTV